MGLEADRIKYQDYSCRNDLDTHMYIHRAKNEQILQLKIRITEADGTKICCKMYYDQCCAEVWTGNSNDKSNRVKIDQVFDIDFSDLEKLKKKIKMYMLFS